MRAYLKAAEKDHSVKGQKTSKSEKVAKRRSDRRRRKFAAEMILSETDTLRNLNVLRKQLSLLLGNLVETALFESCPSSNHRGTALDAQCIEEILKTHDRIWS